MKKKQRLNFLGLLLISLVTSCATPSVPPKLTSFSLNPEEVTVEVGDQIVYTPNFYPLGAEADEVHYLVASGSEHLIEQDEANLNTFTAIGTGEAQVSAYIDKSEDHPQLFALADIHILAAGSIVDVTKIEIRTDKSELKVGETTKTEALIFPSNATIKDIAWASSNPNVASVDDNGTITAISLGTTDVYASAKDGSGVISNKLRIEVKDENIGGDEDGLITSIVISGPTSLPIGSFATYNATVTPANKAHEISWSTSNDLIASIDSSGNLVAIKEGVVEVKAVASDGSGISSNIITLTISKQAAILIQEIRISSSYSNVNVGGNVTINAALVPSNATNKNLNWSSSNTNVATIDSEGVLTALNEGSTNVQAFAKDGSGVSSNIITINVVTSGGGGTYEGYYASINESMSGTTLLNALRSLNSQKRRSTVGYGNMLVSGGSSKSSAFYKTDYDPNHPNQIMTFYSGKFRNSGLNREHVWPSSRGGDYVDNDIHMPRPTITSENGNRGNSFYVEGKNSSSGGWDPAMTDFGLESYRGDSARIIFYCVVASSRLSLVDKTNDSTGNNTMGKLSDLIRWHLSYPVQDRELRRNDGAEDLQGNRNPFIDHPELVCKIWGNTNSSTQSLCGLR